MLLRVIIFITSVLTLFSNYFVYNSSILQKTLILDASSETLSINYNLINKNEISYPSLAFNSVPLLTYISRQDTENKKYHNAISKLEVSLIKNPNCIYSKYLLARNYIFIENLNEAEKTLEKLFNEYPNIESSSALFFAVLELQKNNAKLKSKYSILENINSKVIWSYYISALRSSVYHDKDSIFFNNALIEFNKRF